jgi:uncharacterized repeat protein (TIGR03803 family)
MTTDRFTSALAVIASLGGLISMAAPGTAQAASENVLYSFTGVKTDGCNPVAPVLIGQDGALYGTTASCGGSGNGTAFRLTTQGKEMVLHSFGKKSEPACGLIQDAAGTLYGVALFTKGAPPNAPVIRYEGIFSLTLGGTVTVLAKLPKTAGSLLGGLISDAVGNLYGLGYSIAYELPASAKLRNLHSFKGAKDGFDGQGTLLLDKNGNLFGATYAGGATNHGTLFEISHQRVESVLYSFTGGADGAYPQAGLIEDSAGNLYGTTGGNFSIPGTAFKFSPSGTLTTLHTFGSPDSTTDGVQPIAALVMDSAGNLFGTTQSGGANSAGVVFEISAGGVETIVHNFGSNATDAGGPAAPLVIDNAGHLYGTAEYGGTKGFGAVFEVTP